MTLRKAAVAAAMLTIMSAAKTQALYLTTPTPGPSPTRTATYGPIVGLRSNPFSPDATFSYEPLPGLITANGLPINLLLPKTKAVPLIPLTYVGTASTSSSLMSNDLEEPIVPLTRGIYPWPPIVTDWSSIRRIPIGLQFEGLENYVMPPGAPLRPLAVLLYIRAVMQQINAALIRDAGVEVQVTSVHIQEFDNLYTDTDGGNASASVDAAKRFQYDLVIPEHPHIGLRLGPLIGGGKAHQSGPCVQDGERPINFSRAWFDPSMPIIQDNDNAHNLMLMIIAQELTHHILGLGHAQCYYSPTDGTPIEQWNDGVCWTGENVCPLFTAQSYMGYAYGCTINYGGLKYPPMRIGPAHGPLAEIAHLHAASYDCIGPPIAYLPTDYSISTDTDHDGIPDPIDNCPTVANNQQEDSDGDTIYNSPSWSRGGDACDAGCAITPSSHGAWILLLPITFLWRKHGTIH